MANIDPGEGYKELLFTPATQLDAVGHMLAEPFGFTGASLHLYRQDTALMQPTDPTPRADAVMAVMHLRAFGAHREWNNGRTLAVGAAQVGSFRLYDLRDSHIADVPFPFHTVHVLLPNSALGLANRRKGQELPRWNWDTRAVVEDPVLSHLTQALIPALEDPDCRDKLFCEHVFNAIALHFSKTFGGLSVDDRAPGRVLAGWQESLAKEMLMSRIAGDILMEEVASSCGLSVDSFSRMFCRTTGIPPYRWLSLQRIERAKILLRQTGNSLAEVALACGFANQSHFTRAFSRAVRISPGEWRRRAVL